MTREELGSRPNQDMSQDTRKAAARLGRPLLTAVLFGGALLLLVGPGCGSEGIGDPCVPEQEYDQNFLGFDRNEVNVESKSFQCRTRVCLVNHFQGRVSCPYGQGKGGEAPAGKNCTIPGTSTAIEGAKVPNTNDFVDTSKASEVKPQCLDRTADKAVYCSCRCADLNGQRPGDQAFCDCPDGFACERLVTSIGQGNEGLTGSYCVKKNTTYEPSTACMSGECDRSNDKSKCAGESE